MAGFDYFITKCINCNNYDKCMKFNRGENEITCIGYKQTEESKERAEDIEDYNDYKF